MDWIEAKFTRLTFAKKKKRDSWWGKQSKPVEMYDKDGKLVYTFKCLRDVDKFGLNRGNVSSCCNGKLKDYLGYTFKFAEN